MDTWGKLKVLTDSAKYDVACTSSGVAKNPTKGGIGSAQLSGICHVFSADGRCVSLLKVLMGNVCIYDCKYCINRKSNDIVRAVFTPRELADLTMQFYRRNYIEGLFLSSGVIVSPDYTCELMIKTLLILRNEYRFSGYIHAKAIPGADKDLLNKIGVLVDRMSVNIEMPSQESLQKLAPDKSKNTVLAPMSYIKNRLEENTRDLVVYKNAPKFAPAGQSTQMIIGASPETDKHILHLSENLYNKYKLKRVFYSAYLPVVKDSMLPSLDTKPPLLREHRLYQADWLLRFYKFTANEILDEKQPNFNPFLDPKCNWAINHMEYFPVEINSASYEELLRVPGIGIKSAQKIMIARRSVSLDFDSLKKLGVVLKRAQFFIICNGKSKQKIHGRLDNLLATIMSKKELAMYQEQISFGHKQLSLFETPQLLQEDWQKCLTGQM